VLRDPIGRVRATYVARRWELAILYPSLTFFGQHMVTKAPSDYKIGDEVRLKTRGPRMVVHTVRDNSHYDCQWFDKNDLHTGFFNGVNLVPDPKEE
jgi:uncharacterized protein YodC (DUF2158 family)